jgi:hypothetical protein
MKKIRGLCAVTTLLIVLSVSVVAGDISTNVIPPPPPPASATTTEPGHITTDETQNAIEAETLITEITLSLLQLLAVF